VLDHPEGPKAYDGDLHFGNIGQTLLDNVARGDSVVLGRLSQGTAKPGFSAPWILVEASDADVELAESWLAASTGHGAVEPVDEPVSTPAPVIDDEEPF
jgi:hypothetical protein